MGYRFSVKAIKDVLNTDTRLHAEGPNQALREIDVATASEDIAVMSFHTPAKGNKTGHEAL